MWWVGIPKEYFQTQPLFNKLSADCTFPTKKIKIQGVESLCWRASKCHHSKWPNKFVQFTVQWAKDQKQICVKATFFGKMLSSSVYNPSSWSPGTRTGDQRLDQSVDHDKFLTNYSNMYGFWKPAFMQQLNYPTTFHARINPYKSKRGPRSAPIPLLALSDIQLALTRKGCWQTPHSTVSVPELGSCTC